MLNAASDATGGCSVFSACSCVELTCSCQFRLDNFHNSFLSSWLGFASKDHKRGLYLSTAGVSRLVKLMRSGALTMGSTELKFLTKQTIAYRRLYLACILASFGTLLPCNKTILCQ